MPHANHSRTLPLVPLLATFRSGRTTAPRALPPDPTVGFLDTATPERLSAVVRAFAEAVLPVCFHLDFVTAQIRYLRHALNHLLRGEDPLAERLARCATPGEVYFVAGLGPGFWSAFAAAELEHVPRWCPAVEAGLVHLGLLREVATDVRARFEAVCRGVDVVRERAPDLTALDVSEFLERVARTAGREFPPAGSAPGAFAWAATPERIVRAVREVRSRAPLRARIRGTTEERAAAIGRFRVALRAGEYVRALAAFREAFPDARWETALPALDDAYSPALPEELRARLWCDVAHCLRERFRIHPLELADVILAVTGDGEPESAVRGGRGEPRGSSPPEFAGFCTDTFAFLTELVSANTKDWMTDNRERYQFVLREPLIELCESVAERYVQPVLNREYGWNLECDARSGRAVTSICKNDFGRGGPYQPVQWITFYRQAQANKRSDAQLFVRVAPDGVRYGFHLGRTARVAGKQFRANIQEHGEAIHRALRAGEVFAECRFWVGDDLAGEVSVKTAADLRAWAVHRTIAIGKHLPPDAALLRRDELAGDILLLFDRLLPAFACAAEADPRPLLARRAGAAESAPPYNPASFHQETYLSEVWLDRVFALLRLKKQLILQGVPGTGKTHEARCLARLLTHDRPECVRLVQFHPAYSYEEFVEGIRARGAEVNGRSEVTFPVEDGVLCQFAEQAAKRPSEPHVLLVDELNRGNLPRIFGELLYLLEYRDQALTLPYSKRAFRLPENLFLLATMNPLDRSALALDQALRRRFSFVTMPADPTVLASWLGRHAPAEHDDESFGPRVVQLFEELNRRLAREAGSEKQIGHSFFMVPELTAEKLAAVWDHHVRPLLLDYLGGREDRLREFTPEHLLAPRTEKRRKPKPVPNEE
jgi:MoxR-like ATPase